MSATIVCPNCGHKFHVLESAAGQPGMCPSCGTTVVVPGAAHDAGAPSLNPGGGDPPFSHSSPAPKPGPATQRVVVVDVDMPFMAIVRLILKWSIAALLVSLLISLVVFVLVAVVLVPLMILSQALGWSAPNPAP